MKFGLGKFSAVAFLSLLLVSSAFAQAYCSEPGSIKRVKNRSVGNVEYVIFDVIKSGNGLYDSYEVSSASPPFTGYVEADGEIPVKGAKFRKIVFRFVTWTCKTRNQTRTPRRAVKDIKELYTFEGIADYVVGYSARSRYVATYHYDAGSVTKVVMKFRR